jgi:hypothetical protein
MTEPSDPARRAPGPNGTAAGTSALRVIGGWIVTPKPD